MRWLCKVLQNGDDAVVELPDEWVARYGVKVGDELRISYSSDGKSYIPSSTKVKAKKLARRRGARRLGCFLA